MKNIISGPCSIESKEQFNEVLKELLSLGIYNIRAGVWKPRTNQGAFEGLGEDALKIIKEAKATYEFNSIIEVANSKQVALAEKYEIDSFWIGARTTSSPFSVQELSDSITDKDKQILIKNPINYDTKLWIGAINRFIKNGFTNVKPIFRGYDIAGAYRNQIVFSALEELIKEFNYIKEDIIIDVSHIAGDRKYIREIVNKFKECGYNNFMLETHCNPLQALTDSNQQIPPSYLNSYLSSETTLDFERRAIDDVDAQIINLLDKRFELSNDIGQKKKYILNRPEIFDKERYENIKEKYGKYTVIFNEIHSMSVAKQKEL